MHGMWVFAFARRTIQQRVGQLATFEADFLGMVGGGEPLYLQARHTGMRDGRKVVAVEVVNERGDAVLRARAEVEPPQSAFVFTGQGSAEVGMGMARYAESSAARELWDRADSHLMQLYGFSILNIVRNNPSSLKVHFGGKAGKAIRNNYQRLRLQRNGIDLPLFPDINDATRTFVFNAPIGLLFATQFNQPALVLMEKAAFQELHNAGFVASDSIFAGHSLGEYAGLVSVASVLSIEDLVEMVFIRGMLMQRAVERDAQGRSAYSMVAVSPSRIGYGFDDASLFDVVQQVDALAHQLQGKGASAAHSVYVQVVNYNIEGHQYVVAGTTHALLALCVGLDGFNASRGERSVLEIAAPLLERDPSADAILERGVATIPLHGIDVPFHSRQLLPGVPAFRDILSSKMSEAALGGTLDRLVGKYIPNVVGLPFELTREYVTLIYDETKSKVLGKLLADGGWPASPTKIAKCLLVELLAHQFAMPVKWIATQNWMLTNGVRRIVEVGPAPTLTNMAKRTLKADRYWQVSCDVFWLSKDEDAVCYRDGGDVGPTLDAFLTARAPPAEAAPAAVVSPAATLAADPLSAAAPAPAAPALAAAGPVAEEIPDVRLEVLFVLRVLLSIKLKKPLDNIQNGSTMRELTGGKSAVQNEIMGDLQIEFGAGPESGGGDLPLTALAAAFIAYNGIGKVCNGMINRLMSTKMPSDFGLAAVRTYLGQMHGLGAGRCPGTTLPPTSIA